MTSAAARAEPALLREWLGPVALEAFLASHLGRLPIAQPGTATGARTLCDWSVLEAVLAATDPPPDVLVVARGRLLPVPAPRSLAELRALLARGVGLSLRRTERCHPSLERVAAAFRPLGRSHVQLFVTPARTYGFGWHYDDEDVFIAQTAGVKDYYFRANTVAREPATAAAFRRLASESSPVYSARLAPGDFLYVPARWWHTALCVQDALSISVGVHVDEHTRA
ncbi:MAG: cupin domain-containing protein [Thermodesulfobacteriota bacterium]